MSIFSDERGAVYPYLMFWVVIIVCAFMWIAFNEMILHVADWVSASATQADGGTWEILLSLYRATPVVIILSTLMWAILQSHRGTEVYA